jgi:hypothetical protein
MPTLDWLLSWSDSDTEDDDNGQEGHTPTRSSWSLVAVDDSSYDRCSAPSFVDDVLVPREVADDGRGVSVGYAQGTSANRAPQVPANT